MNFVFISPNYPENYWLFCRGLKKQGIKVLAIVDTPYSNLNPNLIKNIDDCYVVPSFHNYSDMLKACGFFTYKYGKIDWIESNNEAWLDLDAKLREDFNVTTGFSYSQIKEFQSKTAMKKYYKQANIPTARYKQLFSLQDAFDFANNIGYPLVLKPDQGVGANNTYTIHNEKELQDYYDATKEKKMILEEYIHGDIFTLDGICDRNGTIQYLNSLEYIGNCMDTVTKKTSIGAFTATKISEANRQMIQNLIDAFHLKSRFFHCEFFRLKEDHPNIGKKGTPVGLEINFRPPGGFIPDLMNYSSDIDVYNIWAELLIKNHTTYPKTTKKYACFAGRRDSIHYKYSINDLKTIFNDAIIEIKKMPYVFSVAMGNEIILARFTTVKEKNHFYKIAFETKKKEYNDKKI